MRILRRLLGIGLLVGLVYGLWRVLQSRGGSTDTAAWESQPFPFPPVPRPDGDGGAAPGPEHHIHVPGVLEPGGGPETDASAFEEPWMEPIDGACPASHPVKAKLSSGIFHVPGGRNYDRTKPDRCYIDPAAATADGLRPSKT